jgi:hypothetical protein
MKIYQLLDIPVILNNEEERFLESHSDRLSIDSLYEREYIVAQNLVRKGVYSISNDSKHLIKANDRS